MKAKLKKPHDYDRWPEPVKIYNFDTGLVRGCFIPYERIGKFLVHQHVVWIQNNGFMLSKGWTVTHEKTGVKVCEAMVQQNHAVRLAHMAADIANDIHLWLAKDPDATARIVAWANKRPDRLAARDTD